MLLLIVLLKLAKVGLSHPHSVGRMWFPTELCSEVVVTKRHMLQLTGFITTRSLMNSFRTYLYYIYIYMWLYLIIMSLCDSMILNESSVNPHAAVWGLFPIILSLLIAHFNRTTVNPTCQVGCCHAAQWSQSVVIMSIQKRTLFFAELI